MQHTKTFTPHPALRATLSLKGRGFSSAWRARASLTPIIPRLIFQTAKLRRPCCLRRGRAVFHLCSFGKPEGAERREAHRNESALGQRGALLGEEKRRAFRRSTGGFARRITTSQALGTNVRNSAGRTRQRLFRSRDFTAVLVPRIEAFTICAKQTAPRVPRPPGHAVTSRTRRRRIPSRFHDVS